MPAVWHLCADSCEAAGLSVQELAAASKNRLRKFLPATASVANPVDMIASAGAEDFRKAAEILLAAPEVDSLIVLTIHVGLADTAAIGRAICAGVSAARRPGAQSKPVLTCIMDKAHAGKPIRANGEQLPNYFPESARGFGKARRYAEWRNQAPGAVPDFDDIQPQAARTLCRTALQESGAGWLSAEQTRSVLSAFALPLPRAGICRTAEEAAALSQDIGFPVALKLASRQIVHKSEFGGVRLNLQVVYLVTLR
jgi:acyl-CoA synthetase (NDP forming)